MPSQLITNEHIWFMCARDFTFNGKDYKLGDKFDQDESLGRIDTLVRTRRLVAVVDSTDVKPRHWHHHVWLKKDIQKKLGLLRKDSDDLTGESLYNKPQQTEPRDASDSTTPEVWDASDEIRQAMQENITKEQEEMDKKRKEELDLERVTTDNEGEPVTIDGVEQTEPLERVEPDQGRDISDLTGDKPGSYKPHDGKLVDETNATKNKDKDADANQDSSTAVAARREAAKKTTAKKTAAPKKK